MSRQMRIIHAMSEAPPPPPEDSIHSDNEDSNPPEDTSTIPSEFEGTMTATLQEYPDANISHLIFALEHHQSSRNPTAAPITAPTQIKERNQYHPLLLVEAQEKITNLQDPTTSVIANHSFNFTTNFKQTKGRLAHLCALLLACTSEGESTVTPSRIAKVEKYYCMSGTDEGISEEGKSILDKYIVALKNVCDEDVELYKSVYQTRFSTTILKFRSSIRKEYNIGVWSHMVDDDYSATKLWLKCPVSSITNG